MSTPRKLRTLQLIALTFFIVSGGPFGLEEILASLGATGALAILAVTPILWSLPTALLVGELAAALPHEGGYYAWVRRALGPFWGVQEAWWSLAASVFDMAIYPTLFGLYLVRLHPWFAGLELHFGIALLVVVTLLNLRGPELVGQASVWLSALVILPFLAIALLPSGEAAPRAPAAFDATAVGAGLSVAMWNYMGWDNAATFVTQVERPGRTYPLGVLGALGLIMLCYLLPVWGVERSGADVSDWTTGAWVDFAATHVHPWLGTVLSLGGALSAAGMFNALVLSYSRLPLAMAEDGALPAVVAKKSARGVPIYAVLGLALCYGLALGLGFKRLVELDILLYGLSLVLEFAALIALRVREPLLERPFRIRGGLAVVIALSMLPTAFVAYSGYTTLVGEHADHAWTLAVAVLVAGVAMGAWVVRALRSADKQARATKAAPAP